MEKRIPQGRHIHSKRWREDHGQCDPRYLDISYFMSGPVALYFVRGNKKITVAAKTMKVASLDEFKRQIKNPIAMYRLFAVDGGYLIRFGEV